MTTDNKGHISYLARMLRKKDLTLLLVSIHNLMGCFSFKRLYKRMASNANGQIILQRRPRVNTETISLEKLKTLPKDSFGYQFAEHLLVHGFEKGIDSPPRSPFENENTAYAKARWRETHDYRHVLTGMPAKLADETILAAFQYGNHPNSWSMMVCIIGPLFSFSPISPLKQWARMPEAYRAGRAATCLASVDYEAEFGTPVDDLRKKWNVKNLEHLGTLKPISHDYELGGKHEP